MKYLIGFGAGVVAGWWLSRSWLAPAVTVNAHRLGLPAGVLQ